MLIKHCNVTKNKTSKLRKLFHNYQMRGREELLSEEDQVHVL